MRTNFEPKNQYSPPPRNSRSRVSFGTSSAAKGANLDFAVDVYPHYGSDAEAALRAGWDCRHGLIGSGVYASHGYERSHKKGVENTLGLLISYLG